MKFQMYMASKATGQKLSGLTPIEAKTFDSARMEYRSRLRAHNPKLDLSSVDLLAEVQ